MKRSEFLKKLGVGIGVVAIAPRLIAEMKPNNVMTARKGRLRGIIWDKDYRWRTPVHKGHINASELIITEGNYVKIYSGACDMSAPFTMTNNGFIIDTPK